MHNFRHYEILQAVPFQRAALRAFHMKPPPGKGVKIAEWPGIAADRTFESPLGAVRHLEQRRRQSDCSSNSVKQVIHSYLMKEISLIQGIISIKPKGGQRMELAHESFLLRKTSLKTSD